jgi:hypothetical protein
VAILQLAYLLLVCLDQFGNLILMGLFRNLDGAQLSR